MKQYNVMLKPASSLCNLRCRYCFYCDVADLREVRSFGIMKIVSQFLFNERFINAICNSYSKSENARSPLNTASA